MLANDIDQLIERLDTIIDAAKSQRSRIAFFPALYRQVTLKIKQSIAENRFDDNPRMSELTTNFGNRYVAALDAYRQGAQPSKSWQIAFEATNDSSLIILQHLLLGINAHINLDLGISAAETAPGDQLSSLERDFNRINDILAECLELVQPVINQFSPFVGLLDLVGGRTDEEIANFSIIKARQEAWEYAQILAYQTPEQRQGAIAIIDRKVAILGNIIANPHGFLKPVIDLIRWQESDDIVAILDALIG